MSVMHDFEIKRLIESTKNTYAAWQKRLTKNGPSDEAALAGMTRAAIELSLLERMQLSYFTT